MLLSLRFRRAVHTFCFGQNQPAPAHHCLSLTCIYMKGDLTWQSFDDLGVMKTVVDWRIFGGFPGGSDGKESACNAGDPGLIPGLGRSPGGGHGYPLQYSCLENPMARGAWRAEVHSVTKNRTWLRWLSTHMQHSTVKQLSFNLKEINKKTF